MRGESTAKMSSPDDVAPQHSRGGPGVEWLLLACGVVAAMHVGKLPPALPVLRQALGTTLVEAGFLLSTVQLGSMLLGLALGLSAQRLGLKRSLTGGLGLLAVASLAGTQAGTATGLLAARAAEGLGVLMVALAAPSLLRRTVPAHRQALRLGLWGTYMPMGTGLALLVGPWWLARGDWQGWWIALGLLTAAMAGAAARVLPADHRPQATTATRPHPVLLRATLQQPAPWLLGLCFGAYSAQWLTVIGFLPTIYAEAGLAAGLAGVLTALAALANALGNAMGSWLLHRGVAPLRLLWTGFAAMAAGAVVAFGAQEHLGLPLRYAAILLFSGMGGLVPSTLFALSGRACTDARAMPVVVGLMTQGTGAGQFLGPPAAAWWAVSQGGWSHTWMATGAAALAGAALAAGLALVLRPAHTGPGATPRRPAGTPK